MASDLDPVWDVVSEHLGDMTTTPAGSGTVVGLVDRNDKLGLLVDVGERLAGDIPVVVAFRVVRTESGLQVTSMARAAKVAAGQEGALEHG